MVGNPGSKEISEAAERQADNVVAAPDEFTKQGITDLELNEKRASKASFRAAEAQADLKVSLEKNVDWLKKEYENQRQMILGLQAQTKELSETKAELEKFKSPRQLRNKILHGSSLMEGVGALAFTVYPFVSSKYSGETWVFTIYGLGLGLLLFAIVWKFIIGMND